MDRKTRAIVAAILIAAVLLAGMMYVTSWRDTEYQTMGAVLDGVSDQDKIDSAAADGLSGVSDSLAYRVGEIERHLHSNEVWFEKALTQTGEITIATRIGASDGNGVFQCDAGNDDWSSWIQILGSSDTPAISGNTKFDLNRIEVTSAERNAIYFVQIGFGATGTATLSANTYTEMVFKPASNQVDSGPVDVQSRRQAVGTKAWFRCMCPGQNTATLDLMLGLHEYEG